MANGIEENVSEEGIDTEIVENGAKVETRTLVVVVIVRGPFG